jgi:acetyl-CoA carboxylase carboxyl transferase subunit alpha
VPVVVLVLGEGGSGGALAIGIGDRVLMMENAVYS